MNHIPPLAQARLREAEAREAALKAQTEQNEQQSNSKTKKASSTANS